MAVRTEFNDILHELRDEATPISPSHLYQLSTPSRDDMMAFGHHWPHVDVKRRRQVVHFLADIAEENFKVDFRGIFRFCLDDPDAEVRATAIDGLWEDEDINLIAPFVHLLQDDLSVTVRASAASALGKYMLLGELERLGEGEVTFVRQALIDTIRQRDEDVDVRRRAVESVSYADDEEVRGIIQAAYYAPEEKMRASAIFAMGRSADSRWRSPVQMELENPNPEIRYEAARASGELEDRKAVPQLIHLLDDPDREVQGAAIWALGQVGGQAARQALEAACENPDAELANTAEDALAELEFNSGTDPLLLYDIRPTASNGHGPSQEDGLDEDALSIPEEDDDTDFGDDETDDSLGDEDLLDDDLTDGEDEDFFAEFDEFDEDDWDDEEDWDDESEA